MRIDVRTIDVPFRKIIESFRCVYLKRRPKSLQKMYLTPSPESCAFARLKIASLNFDGDKLLLLFWQLLLFDLTIGMYRWIIPAAYIVIWMFKRWYQIWCAASSTCCQLPCVKCEFPISSPTGSQNLF